METRDQRGQDFRLTNKRRLDIRGGEAAAWVRHGNTRQWPSFAVLRAESIARCECTVWKQCRRRIHSIRSADDGIGGLRESTWRSGGSESSNGQLTSAHQRDKRSHATQRSLPTCTLHACVCAVGLTRAKSARTERPSNERRSSRERARDGSATAAPLPRCRLRRGGECMLGVGVGPSEGWKEGGRERGGQRQRKPRTSAAAAAAGFFWRFCHWQKRNGNAIQTRLLCFGCSPHTQMKARGISDWAMCGADLLAGSCGTLSEARREVSSKARRAASDDAGRMRE